MWHGLPAHENTAKMAVPQIGFELALFLRRQKAAISPYYVIIKELTLNYLF